MIEYWKSIGRGRTELKRRRKIRTEDIIVIV